MCNNSKNIYGPYFFENTVNQHTYLDMLKNIFWQNHLKTSDYKNFYFQQDGETAQTATSVEDWQKSKFGDKFIDKKKLPPRSPDLNPYDFYLTRPYSYIKIFQILLTLL